MGTTRSLKLTGPLIRARKKGVVKTRFSYGSRSFKPIAVHEYSMPDDSPVTCLSRDLLVQEHLWENNTNEESGRLDTNLSSELTAQNFRSLRVKIVCEREKHGVNILCATCISQVSQWAILQLSQTSVSKQG